jgi:FtsZ-binding cell division protein ZapB
MTKAKLTEAAKAYTEEVRSHFAEDDVLKLQDVLPIVERTFENAAQWYERSLEGVGVEGARKWTITEDDVGNLTGATKGSLTRLHKPGYACIDIKAIEALPVQALIASQQREIEELRALNKRIESDMNAVSEKSRALFVENSKLRTEKQDWFNGAALNDLYIEQGEEIELQRQRISELTSALEKVKSEAQTGLYSGHQIGLAGSLKSIELSCSEALKEKA